MRYSKFQVFQTRGTGRKGNRARALRRQGIETARQQRNSQKAFRRLAKENGQ